jgi:hypothetical protein
MPYVRAWVDQDYQWRGVQQHELHDEDHDEGIDEQNPSLVTGDGYWSAGQVKAWNIGELLSLIGADDSAEREVKLVRDIETDVVHDRAEINGLWAELQRRIKAFRRMENALRERKEFAEVQQRQVQTRFKAFEDNTKIGTRKKRTKESKGKEKDEEKEREEERGKESSLSHSLPKGWRARYRHLLEDMLGANLGSTSDDAVAVFLKQKRSRVGK